MRITNNQNISIRITCIDNCVSGGGLRDGNQEMDYRCGWTGDMIYHSHDYAPEDKKYDL